MTSKSMKASAPVKAPALTKEQIEKQAQFRLLQRRETFAVGAMNAILQGMGDAVQPDDADEIAKTAVAIADAMLRELFGADVKRDPTEA